MTTSRLATQKTHVYLNQLNGLPFLTLPLYQHEIHNQIIIIIAAKLNVATKYLYIRIKCFTAFNDPSNAEDVRYESRVSPSAERQHNHHSYD